MKRRGLSVLLAMAILAGLITCTACAYCRHQPGEWMVLREPTCIAEGCRAKCCRLCGTIVEQQPIAISHQPGEWEPVWEATCYTEGRREKRCRLCGTIVEQQTIVLSHQPGEWKTVREASCSTEGCRETYCQLCGQMLEYEILSELEVHELDQVIVNRAPTCTYAGYYVQSCACGEKRSEVFTSSLGGHVDGDGDENCDVCGEQLYRIPVTLQFEGNASAAAPDFVLISKEHGGIVNMQMGENSILRTSHTLFGRLPDDPSGVGGNIVTDKIRFISKFPYEIDALTANRHYRVYYSDTFGMPQEIFLTVADMTQTALVIVDFRNPDLSEYYGTAQVFLRWGKRVNPDDEEAMRDPQNKMAIELPFMPPNVEFHYFCDAEGRVLTYDTVAELTPVQEITWLYAVVSDRTE